MIKVLLTFLLVLSVSAQETLVVQTAIEKDMDLIFLSLSDSNKLCKFSRNDLNKVNTARQLLGDHAIDWESARTNRSDNAVVLASRLKMLETEIGEKFLKEKGRRADSSDILACWLVGVSRFERMNFDKSKITDPRMQLVLVTFQKDKENRVLKLRSQSPTPPKPPVPLEKREQPKIP